ncbi:MAG TPA: hypothetical protein VKC51_09140 [Lacunisphaera sp.]|nr:hypothetical protein [Lacunisphaera sp.]
MSDTPRKERANLTPLYFLRIDPTAELSVTVGWKSPAGLRSKLAELISAGKYPKARLRISKPHPTEFKMVIEDLEK